MAPRFLFRIDASPAAGMGHLRRCLTLALELRAQGAEVFFACRVESFDLKEILLPVASEWEAYDWSLTPDEDARKVIQSAGRWHADAVIIDHYRADEDYQKALYESGVKWLQFDGAGRCRFWANWVLNVSPAASERHYELLKQREETRLLMGPCYAPLRAEFQKYRDLPARQGPVRTILLTFGGGDDRGATTFCLEALRGLDGEIERVVLLSSANPNRDDILKWVQGNGTRVRIVSDAENMAYVMASADLAVTAGGMTVFELAALGVPVLMLQIADNQVAVARAWQQCGYGVDLGPLERLDPGELQREIMSLMQDTARRESMSARGKALVDGWGAKRVAQALLSSDIRNAE